MSFDRRAFLGRATSATAAVAALGLPQLTGRALAQTAEVPQTGFEQTGTWSTRDEEVALIDAVASGARNPVSISTIGRTAVDDTELLMAAFGPAQEVPGTIPSVVVACTQHGNEPAGRDAGLQLIRDLAFTEDPVLLALMERSHVLVVPTMNPEGRERNSRASALGIDINRDHLSLVTPEARALAGVANAYKPFMVVDHHEYGPSAPVLYDDDVLYLWPRNRNTDLAVQDNARNFCLRYIKGDCEAAGFTADEYGLYRVGPNVGPAATPVTTTGLQMAGDGDDGIARNAAGLRNTMGILVETRVMLDPLRPQEVLVDGQGGSTYGDTVATRARRVASQRVVMDATLRYLREQGEAAMAITEGAGHRKRREGAAGGTIYFDGQDDESNVQADTTSSTADGIAAYRITAEQLAIASADFANNAGGDGTLAGTLGLHEIDLTPDGETGDVLVSLAQQRKNVVPLLLDARGRRHAVAGEALQA